jgi:hypothetical protein
MYFSVSGQDDEVFYVNTCFRSADEVISAPVKLRFVNLGLPELTEIHLLETFMESGITYGGVTSLAVSLDIKNDQTFLRRWSVQPSCLAMMVVKKWLDMKDPTLEEAHQELEKQLRFLDLSKAIPKLQGRRNPSETDPAIVRELLQEQARYFSVSQAYSFGMLLGLKESKIDDLVRSRQLNRGIDVILYIFDHIEASTTHFEDSKLSEIIEALVHVAENSEDICSPIVIVPRTGSVMSMPTASLIQNNNLPRLMSSSEVNLNKLNTLYAQDYRTLILPSKVSEDGPSIASGCSVVNGNQDEAMTVPKKYGNNFNCYKTNMSTINYCKGFFIGMIVMNSIVTFLLLLTIIFLLVF